MIASLRIAMASLALLAFNAFAANPVLQPGSSTPADNTGFVAVDANILLNFDINVYNSSPNAVIELYDATGGGNVLVETFTAVGPYSYSGNNGGNGQIGIPPAPAATSTTIYLNPGVNFNPNSDYYILIPVGSEISDNGNFADFVVPVTDPTTYNFSTAAIAPTATRAVPTLSEWMQILLVLLLGSIALFQISRLKGKTAV